MTTPSVTMLIVIGKYSLTSITSSSLDGFSLLILRLAICVYVSAYVTHSGFVHTECVNSPSVLANNKSYAASFV